MKKHFSLIVVMIAFISNAQLKVISYKDGDQKLNGFGITPEKELKNNPGVLILPAWRGIDEHSKEVAQNLSKLGYFAFIADVYGEGNYPKDAKEAGEKIRFL